MDNIHMRPTRPGTPHANSILALYLDKRVAELRGVKTQREIAAEAGFLKPNIMSMFKTGETQVPLDRIPALAKALEADPAHLFRLGMEDRWPELRSLIGEIFGDRQLATANEAAIFLRKWRIATANVDPAPNAQIDAAVDVMLAEALKTRA